MASLIEIILWELAIYQLETNDPVLGGVDGIDNLQAKQLANRTAYLKQQIEQHAAAADPHTQYLTTAEGNTAIAAAVAALVNASPTTLDTLKELATALGNDANFATTMTNALATKITQAQGDQFYAKLTGASGLIRTMTTPGGALVREWGDAVAATTGSIEFGVSYNCAVNTATGVWAGRDVADICWLEKWSDVGGVKEIWYAPTAAAGVVPAFTRFEAGDLINAIKTITGSLVVSGNASMAAATLAAHGVNLGQFIGANQSLAASGYQKLPGGIIIQWGTVTQANPTNNTFYNFTFPTTFPNACFVVEANVVDDVSSIPALFISSHLSLSQWRAAWGTTSSVRAARFIAIGN